MRLIDADALKARILVEVPGFLDGGSSITKALILAMIGTKSACPTIDATPVVRCKDCVKRNNIKECPIRRTISLIPYSVNLPENIDPTKNGDWFCADGKPYCSRCGCEIEIGQDLCKKCMYEAQAEMEEHERMYEPTYNPEDGSM